MVNIRVDVGQLVQVLLGLFFRLALLGYIGNYRDYSDYIAVVIAFVIPIDPVIDRLAGWSGKTAKKLGGRLPFQHFFLNDFFRIWKNGFENIPYKFSNQGSFGIPVHAMIFGIGEGDYPVDSMFHNAMGNRLDQGAKTIALFTYVPVRRRFAAQFPVGVPN